jgi:hypothetical protein
VGIVIKQEPPSPAKKSTKRTLESVLELSDALDSDSDVEEYIPAASGSRSMMVPVVEIPTTKARHQSNVSRRSKKVRIEDTGGFDVTQVMEDQFRIISESFRALSDILSLCPKKT